MSEAALHDRPLPVGSIGRHASGWWAMLGLVLTEGSLFVYLLFSYYYFAVQPQQDWPPGGLPHFRLSLPNTVILLASSLAVWWGQRAVRRGATLRLVAGLAIGFVLGAVFVGIQFVEWYGKPFALASHPYGSLYYTITGFHMAHVAVGLLILAALILWSALGYFGPVRHAAVSIGAMYWHFVDAVWIAVFFTFYVTPYLR